MSRRFDLDQLRAEANLEPVEVAVAGETFTLPAVLPVALSLQLNALTAAGVTDQVAERVFHTLVAALVGEDRAERFMGLVALDELQHVLLAAYGTNVGESSALEPSSPNGGRLPRPTAPATTAPS